MTPPNSYDAKVIVTSHWHGTFTAPNATIADELARTAFDDGELEQCEEEITYVDVRPALKTFKVRFAVEQGFTVLIQAATAADAEASLRKQLSNDHCVPSSSEHGHFEGTVIDAQEVTP
jgi:hypothetical protein